MRTTGAAALLIGVVVISACARTFVTPFQLQNHEWQQVYRDSSYEVSLDVAHVTPGPEPDSLEVWYQTRHLERRDFNGSPWNREVIRSLLRCEPLSFKTVLTTIFLDNGPPLAQVGDDLSAVKGSDWRPVNPDSVDERAMRGACAVIAARDYAPSSSASPMRIPSGPRM